MRSSVEAFKLAGGLFLIPFMMAYTGLINTDGDVLGLFIAILQTIAIIIALAVAIEGYLLHELTGTERLLSIASLPVLLFNPAGFWFAGVLLIAVIVGLQWRNREAHPVP